MPFHKRIFLLFLCSAFAVFITFICFQRYVYVAGAVDLGSTRGIHPYAEKIYLADKSALLDYLTTLDAPDPFVIWQVHDDPDLLGVYVSGSAFSVPVFDGTFFQESAFFQDKKLAVVGNSYAGATHVSLFETVYEIIGTVGYDFPTQFDAAIYYNLDSSPYGGTFYLDAPDADVVSRLLSDMSQKLDILSVDDPRVEISRIIDRDGIFDFICAGYVLLLMGFLFLCNTVAFRMLRAHMLVRKLFGISGIKIVAGFSALLTAVSLGCFLTTLLASLLLGILKLGYCVYELLLPGLLLTVFLFLTFVFSLSFQLRRMKLS